VPPGPGVELSNPPLADASSPAVAHPDRLLPIAGVVVVYLACYWIVTRVTLARGPDVLFDTTIALDRLIPHVPGTWPFYWIAYPFVLLGAGNALLRMPAPAFRRALVTAVAMRGWACRCSGLPGNRCSGPPGLAAKTRPLWPATRGQRDDEADPAR
jgi:hypothetical protein